MTQWPTEWGLGDGMLPKKEFHSLEIVVGFSA